MLSCFIYEAGDFGDYDYHSPYYIVSVVLHDQSESIKKQVDGLESYLSNMGYANHALHTGPLIRREEDYEFLLMEDRRKLFNLLFRFTRMLPITFLTAKVRKSECKDTDELESKLAEKEQDDNKFFEQLQEIDTLNETVSNLEKSVESLMDKYNELRSKFDEKSALLESAYTKIASLEKTVADRVADLKSIADVFASTAAAVAKSAASVKKQTEKIEKESNTESA